MPPAVGRVCLEAAVILRRYRGFGPDHRSRFRYKLPCLEVEDLAGILHAEIAAILAERESLVDKRIVEWYPGRSLRQIVVIVDGQSEGAPDDDLRIVGGESSCQDGPPAPLRHPG